MSSLPFAEELSETSCRVAPRLLSQMAPANAFGGGPD
jgi:hypothetical protein